MHEFSLVRSLLTQVLTAAEQTPADRIRNVRVSVGPLTGVEPVLVRQAFDTLKPAMGFADCELQIDEQKLEAVCRQCDLDFEVLGFNFCCPRCQSVSIRITQGDEFRLMSIEVTEDEHCHAHNPS